MPNFLYGTARTRFLWGGIAWSTSTFGILFLNGSAAAGGSANPSYNVTGIGTTGWQGASVAGPFLSDVLTGWRARGAASSAATAMDLNSRTYVSNGSVAATVFTPTPGGGGFLSTIDGAARGNNITFASVAQSFGTLTAFLLFKDSGADNTSDLIAYFDQATNLPIPANGGDITIQWSTTALSDFIFKL